MDRSSVQIYGLVATVEGVLSGATWADEDGEAYLMLEVTHAEAREMTRCLGSAATLAATVRHDETA